MKIVELGIEIQEFDKKKDRYDIIIYNEDTFRKNFTFYYEKVGTNYEQIINDLKQYHTDPEKQFIESFIKNVKKTVGITDLNKLLKVIRKDKIKRLNIL